MADWIPVSERLPDESEEVLFVTMEQSICSGEVGPAIHIGTMYTANAMLYAYPNDVEEEFAAPMTELDSRDEGAITHWMPLPAPPVADPLGERK